MIYLLDVNALVALGFVNHEFHDRVVSWICAQNSPALATCSIAELGFVRVLAQAPAYGFTIPQARALLMRLKGRAASASHSCPTSTMFLTFQLGSEQRSKLPTVT